MKIGSESKLRGTCRNFAEADEDTDNKRVRKKKRKPDSLDVHHEGLDRKPEISLRICKETLSESERGQVDGDKPWDESLHRAFVEAIFEIGLRHSSPSTIVENMSNHPPLLTSERVKSHLQKTRLHGAREKESFLDDYDVFVRQALKGLKSLRQPSSHFPVPIKLMNQIDKAFLGGKVAAYLTLRIICDSSALCKEGQIGQETLGPLKAAPSLSEDSVGSQVIRIPKPLVNDDERDSPLGTAMRLSIGLLENISKMLLEQRRHRIMSIKPTSSSSYSSCGEAKHAQPTLSNSDGEKFWEDATGNKSVGTVAESMCDGMSLASSSSSFDDQDFLLLRPYESGLLVEPSRLIAADNATTSFNFSLEPRPLTTRTSEPRDSGFYGPSEVHSMPETSPFTTVPHNDWGGNHEPRQGIVPQTASLRLNPHPPYHPYGCLSPLWSAKHDNNAFRHDSLQSPTIVPSAMMDKNPFEAIFQNPLLASELSPSSIAELPVTYMTNTSYPQIDQEDESNSAMLFQENAYFVESASTFKGNFS